MNPQDSCRIVITKVLAKDLKIGFRSTTPSQYLDLPTAKAIYNAWMETAMIDNHGMVWVLTNRLGTILRTSKSNAQYIAETIREEHKRGSTAGEYLRYSEVDRILNNVIQEAGTISRERYAGYSESIGMEIRDCPDARLLRANAYESMEKTRRQLKSRRVRQFSLKNDELTGKPLLSTSHFSHIRSSSVYPHLSCFSWNGLVVNRDIHRIITDRAINDESQLFDLCWEQKWLIDWYKPYRSTLHRA